jgi:hypothetical protein
MNHRDVLTGYLDEAAGRSHRDDVTLPTTGGPAGNARLTAWIGVVLLVLFGAEMVTLLEVHSLLRWHIVLGIALIPPALLKTGTTLWRFTRYYAGNQPYRRSGPPPLLLRVLGPLVVLSTLGVLGSGVALIVAGQAASQRPLLGFATRVPLDLVSLHKAIFLVWAGVTGLHVLGRLVPALRLTFGARSAVAGGRARVWIATLAVAVAGLSVPLVWSTADHWRTTGEHEHVTKYVHP